jgi:diacylglycerol kinase family enzyme
MKENTALKLLFIVNRFSGSGATDWSLKINTYFQSLPHQFKIHQLTRECTVQSIKGLISQFLPKRVIAVGGDGTVKLVAECLMFSSVPLGIIPAGSANGLAKELRIPENPQLNLDVILAGFTKKIHLTNINDQVCIHLSDIGLNAYAMKKFSDQNKRGMWGYFIASFRVLLQNPTMDVRMEIDGKIITQRAEMIVIANATRYGSGAIINPVGKLDDDLFEVIVVKKVSVLEILKMIFSHTPFDPSKTEVFQTHDLLMSSTHKVHFQVDGEYCGKVNEVKATLIPDTIDVIIPAE